MLIGNGHVTPDVRADRTWQPFEPIARNLITRSLTPRAPGQKCGLLTDHVFTPCAAAGIAERAHNLRRVCGGLLTDHVFTPLSGGEITEGAHNLMCLP